MAVAAVAWSHTMPCSVPVPMGARRQYWPVATDCRMAVWPGWMGLMELGAEGLMAKNCSAAVEPVPAAV